MQFLKELIIFPFFANDETAIAKFWENRTSLLIGPFACVGFLEDRVKNTRGKRPWEPSLLSPQSLVRYYTLLFVNHSNHFLNLFSSVASLAPHPNSNKYNTS
jgi:hypothetical protein